MSGIIQEIKKKVRDQELSFIIGAGFSKNASSQYLSWEGLLQDMIEKIYRNEIKLSHSQCKKKTAYNTYEKCYIEKLVAETGFLGIASEYVRRKGYREAIDIYIEEHIPYAKPGRDGKYLARGQEVDLSLHRKLLSLNAAGIYTFNYDNLLEAAASADQAKKSNSKKSGIARQLDAITGCLSEYRNTFSETPDALKQAVKDDSYAAPRDPLKQLNKCVENLNTFITKELLEKHTISNLEETHASNCKKTEQFIEELSVEKVGIERQLKQIYYPVTESWEISLTNNKKSIFKLHGSLRSDSKEPYGFDGDIHRHYVITQEDYDSYATRHEAFVNLMRISLLKGVFCAIGFSGNDPNFLAWISWVRDVLENGEQNEKEAKVYFIDVDVEKKTIDPDKLQLFKNHRIVYVRLRDIYKDCKSAGELLNAFFNEISPDSSPHQYEEVWKKVDYGYDLDLDFKNRKYHLHDAGTGDLLQLATLNRLPPFNTYSAINRDRIIGDIDTIVSLEQFDKNKARVIYAAIKGQLCPMNFVCTDHAILKKLHEVARTDQTLARAFNLLDIRSAVLEQRQIKIDHTKGDEYSYELCLQYAFSLDFAGLQKTIGEWKPQDNIWQIKRMALQTLLETAEVKNMGKKLQADDFPCDQEFVYAMDILHQIDDDLWQNPEIEEKIKEVASRSPKVVRLFDKTDYFRKKLRPGITKVHPYGDTPYTISADGHNPDLEPSIQLMQTFLELGLPLCSRRRSFYNHNDWYQAFRHIYEYYPIPCLYFSLQYSDHAFLKRVAQDYVYSNKLQNAILKLLDNMLKAALTQETPYEMREAIYKVAPVFMRRVPQGKWLAAFKEIYKQLDLNAVDARKHLRDKLDEFILDGVSIISNNTFKHAVITDCFRVKKINHYHNSLLINAKKDLKGGLNQVDRKRLTDLIATANDEAEYYVLFNFSDYFSDSQRKNFISKLSELPYKKYESIMIEACCEQAKHDEQLSLQLKRFILKSSLLWQTGIAKDSTRVSSGTDSLNINKIQEDISFTPSEIVQIYEKLKKALTAVENIITKLTYKTFANWRKLLLQMKYFLVKNQTILIRQDDYKNTLERVKQAHIRQCNNHRLTELLSSGTGHELFMGIQALFYDVEMYGIEKYLLEYSILAHIIIQHSHEELESCIEHFTYYITTQEDQLNRAQFKPLLKLILEAYRPYFGNNALKWNLPMDKMIAEKSMVDLWALYTRWGEKSDFWETYSPVYSPA